MTQEQSLKMINTFFSEGLGSNFFSSKKEDKLVQVYLDKKLFLSIGYKGADLNLPEECTGNSCIKIIWLVLFNQVLGSYEEFVSDRVSEVLKSPFPLFPYTEEDLFYDFEALKKNNSYKANSGRQIINCFHTSLYKANRKGCLSPFLAWHNEDLVKTTIENRIIYSRDLDDFTILRGFSTSGKAPRVSTFAPSLAKYLVQKYLNDFDEVVDPFSGFSGRLLGAVSLGKRYRGWDINPVTVKESCEMINFMQLENCSVEVQNSKIYKTSGQCLLTCPPYGDLENWDQEIENFDVQFWVKQCLENYDCKRYLLVVPGSFESDNCVEVLSNKNHLNSKSCEKVLLFEKPF